jgi:hypothetical protein
LSLSHNTTGTVAADFGVGIDFRSEDAAGTADVQIGEIDFTWNRATGGNTWGKAEIKLARNATISGSKMFLPGVENSFGGVGQYTAANSAFGDTNGNYPNYRIYVFGETTDGNATNLTFGNSTGGTTISPPSDSTWLINGYVVARRTDANNESAAYFMRGAIDNNAGTVATVAATLINQLEDSAWDATFATPGNVALGVQVTGEAGKTIRWNGYLDIVQVNG